MNKLHDIQKKFDISNNTTTAINSITDKQKLYNDLIIGCFASALYLASTYYDDENSKRVICSLFIATMFLTTRIFANLIIYIMSCGSNKIKLGNSVLEWIFKLYLFIVFLGLMKKINNINYKQIFLVIMVFLVYAAAHLYGDKL
jgi:hypothetical protein